VNHLSHLLQRVGASHTAAAAYLALLLASSTAVYAAATIGSPEVIDNSLQSVDLRDGAAVKGVDIVNGTVAGADVDEATLNGVGRKLVFSANRGTPKTNFGTVAGYTFKAACTSLDTTLFTRVYVNGPAGDRQGLMTVTVNDSTNNAGTRSSGDVITGSTDEQIFVGATFFGSYERASGQIWIRSGATLLKLDVHLLTDYRYAGTCSMYLMVTRGV
jgi:hypothetical protein